MPLCLGDTASVLTHVVKVGRNGRQVVHAKHAKDVGARLGRKVRRKAQPAQLLQPVPSLNFVNAPVPQVFSAHPNHQHLVHNAVPTTFHAVPQQFSHHHVPHAPANLFHFSHHGPAINPALAHFSQHATPIQVAAPVHHVHHPVAPILAPALAPIQIAGPPTAPIQIAALPPAPIQMAAPSPSPLTPAVAPVQIANLPASSLEVIAARDVAPAAPATGPVRKFVERIAVPAPALAPVVKAVAPEPVPVQVVALRDSYGAAPPQPLVFSAPRIQPAYAVAPRTEYLSAAPSAPIAVVKTEQLAAVRAEPIAVIRSVLNAPDTLLAAKDGWDYSFESANGIKQEAVGSLRLVDDTLTTVMRGSYEFIGADSLVYAVEWFADDTGFHATAPHLPRNVEPNHPEVAAAVRSQIAFAEAEDKAAAASGVIGARVPLPAYGY